MTMEEYTLAIQAWVDAHAHSGPEQKEKYAEYTRLNAARARRVAKTYRLSDAMCAWLDSGEAQGQHWVVITESWCGDAVQCLPLIQKWADRAGVPLDIVLRDVPHSIVDDFLTNGGRSIPLWIVSDVNGHVLGQWGPRPATARNMVLAHRNAPAPKPPYSEFVAQVQLWYVRNRGEEIEMEALNLLADLGSSVR